MIAAQTFTYMALFLLSAATSAPRITLRSQPGMCLDSAGADHHTGVQLVACDGSLVAFKAKEVAISFDKDAFCLRNMWTLRSRIECRVAHREGIAQVTSSSY